MRERVRNQIRRNEPNPYATREDFINIFHGDGDELYQLSFLLTRDHAKAEECFLAGIENCVNENSVFREWARIWAKRIIVEDAIRKLRPRPSLPGSSLVAALYTYSEESNGNGSGGHFDLDAVLRLGDFERFVFVMSVLEHYSHHECALLLGCSVWEVRGGLHALEQLAASRQAVSFAL